MTWVWVAAAGAVGSVFRWWVQEAVIRGRDPFFPYGTVIVNLTGCFLIGLAFTLLTTRLAVAPAVRIGILAGFLGGYTTFSTFSFETLRLIEDGAVGLGLLNVVVSVIGGLAATWAGMAIGRAM